MRLVRACPVLFAAGLFSGCGYIHFGRLERTPAAGGDAAMAAAYSNLTTEHKILKQELVLARREGDSLRLAMERAAGAASTAAPTRPDDASPELATLRTSHTQLQEENTRLRSELDRTRRENSSLGDKLKASAAQNEQARHALEMLNVELLAQKEARARTEQAAEAVRAQLNVVLARGAGAETGSLSAARESTAASTAALHLSRSPSAGATPTAELRTDSERLRRASQPAPTGSPPAQAPRVHVVQAGDTLEKIAVTYYGTSDRWRALYEANTALLADGQGLRAGMELQVP